MTRFLYNCDLTCSGENRSDFGPIKLFTSQTLEIFECDGKLLAIAILLRFIEKIVPPCGLDGDGDVCDRNSQRFAIAIVSVL